MDFSGIPLEFYLGLATIMFSAGLFGVLTQKNAVRILIAVEVMLNSANVAVVGFNSVFGFSGFEGWAFFLVVIAVAAAEAAIGLAIFLSVFRNYNEVLVTNIYSLGETEGVL